MAWKGRSGIISHSVRLPTDPGLMGCGNKGPYVRHDGRGSSLWTVCIKPAGHAGDCRYRPLGLIEQRREDPMPPAARCALCPHYGHLPGPCSAEDCLCPERESW